jgi:hypothetical protein
VIGIIRPHHRRSARRGLVATVVGLLTVGLLAPQAGAGPGSPAARRHAHRGVAAASSPQDHSMDMPRTRHNEITGDFLGTLHDQRMVVENGSLNIYDSATNGGALLRSTPTDLGGLPASVLYDSSISDSATANDLAAVPLAWTRDALYMAGLKSVPGGFNSYLYKLPPDGSCATESCAVWAVHDFPSTWGISSEYFIAPSALAAGTISGTPVLALGSTQSVNGGAALFLIKETDGSTLTKYSYPFSTPQTAVTALDWDDSGSGLLAIGAMSGWRKMFAVRVSAQGVISNLTYYDSACCNVSPSPLSAAVGHRVDGSPVLAFGMDDGSVKLWDPKVTSKSFLSQVTGSDAVDALTFTDRIDGSVGLPDLVAVSSQGNSARVLRYSGSTTLSALPVAPSGGTSTDVGGIRAWFPGYKTGYLQFINDTVSDSQIQLDFATRPNAAYGCWFSQGFFGVPGLPSTPVILGSSDRELFQMGVRTAGEGGDCASSDFIGQWAAYVVVTPLGRPADRTVAKLVWSRSGQLTVQSVGGSLELVVQQGPDHTPFGLFQISIQSPAPPGDPAALKVTGKRLDPAGTDQPVYRFDVAASTWPLPFSTPPRKQTVLPPLEVRGTTNTGDTVDLGLLVPQGQPSRATSGSVTLSPVSFYWQNPDTGQQITNVYVQSGNTTSNTVDVTGLPAPAVGTTIGQVVVCPATGSISCDGKADPVANGLDQAPLRIQLYDGNNQVLPLTNPGYGQIYYRDQDGDLLTGLIPADGSSYLRVSPYAGAYPNDGSTSSTTRPPTNGTVGGRFGYLSTTTTLEQDVTAHVGGSALASDPIVVDGTTFTPQVQAGAQAGPGFYVTGCADYTGTNYCRVASITATAPGLFLTSDPDSQELRIGLQFATTALTSLTSLPLQQVAGQPEHTVVANPLTISNGEVSLNTTSGFQPADTVDTWLITHGAQVPVRAVKVGGGN